ncbi:1790_t:CDS:1, partial [Acaulospora colombiana]
DIAKEASRIYNQKFPKPPSPQKGGSGVRQPPRRRSSGINNMSDIINQPLTGSFTQIDDSQRSHHRYYTGDNSLTHNHYHGNHLQSTNVQHIPFPSIADAQYSSSILNRPSVRSARPLPNPYTTTPTSSTFHMPSLPHVNSLTTASFNYMDETGPNDWDFATAAHA